ncbi:MAG: 30S ribosomal protein S6e [Candidatus Aenigmarchaeota archaeon]|nr:30S ribosomal protein S6e [Candidatus Aenigmarchaeota archaeon]
MAVFKFVIGSKKGKCYQLEKEQKECEALFGRKIGDTFSAGLLGLEGYELKITGGSDKDGFPMRPDVNGIVRKRIILTKGIGFSGKKRVRKKIVKIKGLKRRKMIRGNTIDKDIVQINCVVVKEGAKPLEELLGSKTKESETKADEKKEETKPAEKKEEKPIETENKTTGEKKIKEEAKEKTPKEETKQDKKEDKNTKENK